MSYEKLPKAYSQYGASMGRHSHHCDDTRAVLRLHLRHTPLFGDYDSGGAYWGGGPGTLPLWHVWYDGELVTETVDYYVRAKDRNEAKEVVRKQYPNALFYR